MMMGLTLDRQSQQCGQSVFDQQNMPKQKTVLEMQQSSEKHEEEHHANKLSKSTDPKRQASLKQIAGQITGGGGHQVKEPLNIPQQHPLVHPSIKKPHITQILTPIFFTSMLFLMLLSVTSVT